MGIDPEDEYIDELLVGKYTGLEKMNDYWLNRKYRLFVGRP